MAADAGPFRGKRMELLLSRHKGVTIGGVLILVSSGFTFGNYQAKSFCWKAMITLSLS